MILDIAKTLKSYREQLAKIEDSICFSDLPAGANNNLDFSLNDKPLNSQHIEWLRVCNGGRFGSIDLWSLSDLPSQQFYLEPDLLEAYARDNVGLQTYFSQCSIDDFYIFGQVSYEPILINRFTGDIICPIDYESHCLTMPFYEFISEYILGESYAQFFVVGDEQIVDDWLYFIQGNR